MVTMAHPDQDPGIRSASTNESEGPGMPEWYQEAEEVEKTRKVPNVGPEMDQEEAEASDGAEPSSADPFDDAGMAPEGEPQEFPNADESGQDLAAEIERWRTESEKNREKWLRAMAELENFRKRSRREIENSINFANASLLREFLEVLDNFERAHGAANDNEEAAREAYVEGMRLIYQRFVEVLRQNGLERIAATGEEFDPNLHEAVSQIETDEVSSGRIAHVVQEGYRLKDMVLRPAKVVVAK